MVKNPDLMIERAYTPVNDVAADGRLRMVVKRVPGGEVGRCVPPHQS
jgi:cytochrome-b5 reductase